ncbi:MAG: IPTL-CTERM sorting domain-containing protein, partial [Planctomycetes bacterium]|nr:IPTL-CTERM sorting domain-containing protein [Planctomycetota bacterium]
AAVAVETDLDGNPRIVDGDADLIVVVDMVAYEVQSVAIPTISEWGLVTMSLLVLTVGTMIFVRRGSC